MGDATSVETTAIGDPIVTLSNELKSNEIWLEGQTLEIAKYRKLFKVYGTTWGGDGQTTFGVPDFRNRAIWGSGDGTFGYIEAGLPSISHSHSCSSTAVSSGAHTHSISSAGAHTHSIRIGIAAKNTSTGSTGGDNWQNGKTGSSGNHSHSCGSNGNHTHTITSTVGTFTNTGLFGLSDTVQPAALKVRVKARAK